MPPRRRKPSGLTDEDVARLRGQLGEGRKPRVALSGPQFETGSAGTVVRIGDPAVDGADFLTVRVKVNGVTDELAFAPTELSLGGGRAKAAGTGAAGSRAAGSAAAGAGTAGSGAAGGSAGTGPVRAAGPRVTAAKPVPVAGEAPLTGSGATPTSQAGTADRGRPDAPAIPTTPSQPSTAQPAAATGRPAATSPTTTAGQPTTTGPTTAAGRRRKAPAAPTVSVTISSSGATWSVSASRGARTIAKNVPVTPGLVTAIAELLDQPAVSEAVAEINETALQQARQRAEELRAELSDLEAVLAAHQAPGSGR